MSVSKLERIIMHWSAGSYTPSAEDAEHYHFFIDGNGACYAGDHLPEDNLDTTDDDYAAHVKNCNTGSIGIAVCAMAGAVQSPFNAGEYPITENQLKGLVAQVRALCLTYDIEVTRTTVLTHAEVQPTLGIQQDGKWDITWLPGMATTGDPVEVGDRLRAMVGFFTPSTSKGASLEDRVAALEAWAKGFSL